MIVSARKIKNNALPIAQQPSEQSQLDKVDLDIRRASAMNQNFSDMLLQNLCINRDPAQKTDSEVAGGASVGR